MAKFTYEFIDMGWGAIVTKLTKLHNVEVQVGVLGDDGDKVHPGDGGGDITVAEVALINEFGTERNGGKVPERSFMRDVTRRANAVGQFGNHSAQAARAILKGASIAQGLSILGKWGVEKIQENILSNIAPRQAEATIDKKGHDKTLIETDTLFDSITFDITAATGEDD